MGCCSKDKDNFYGQSQEGCICEVVRAIKDLQDNANDSCDCASNCFSEPLGSILPSGRKKTPNTRVFVLKTSDGKPFHAFFKGNECACTSIFFRVEDIFDNCCAVLRVLEPVNRGHGQGHDKTVNLTKNDGIDLAEVCKVDYFRSTNDCITVDLSAFSAIQCIADVDIDLCH